MTKQYLKEINPLEAFIQYIQETKPYHTKIVELLEEYISADDVVITIDDEHFFGDPRCVVKPCQEGCINIVPNPSGDWVGNNYCEYRGIEIVHPARPVQETCLTGYATRPYGSPGLNLIISPNQGKSFEDYPAMDSENNCIYIPGDQTKYFKPGNQISISTRIESDEYKHKVVDFEIDDSDLNNIKYYYYVEGDHTSLYVRGFVFYGDGVAYNKKFSVSEDSVMDGSNTKIEVYPTITEVDAANVRYIGLTARGTVNNGVYTVASSIFNKGTLKRWISELNYELGDDPNTKIVLVEDLDPLPAIDSDFETFASSVTLEARAVEKVLHYSNHLNRLQYAGSPSGSPDMCSPGSDMSEIIQGIEQTPNEGKYCVKILSAIKSTFDINGQVIEGSGNFVFGADLDPSNIFVGDKFDVKNTTENVGTYTITAIEYGTSPQITTVYVAEIIRSTITGGAGGTYPNCETIQCSLNSSQCHDLAQFDIPANLLVIDGDYTSRFTQGERFIIQGGNLQGRYITLSSKVVENKTYIRTTKTLLNKDDGYRILEVNSYTGNSYGFVVEGKIDFLLQEGTKFNIIDSLNNDGFYEVASPGAFISGFNRVEIPIVSETEIDTTSGGYVMPFSPGDIKPYPYGYSEYDQWCENIPYTYVKVRMDEKLKVDGSILSFSENIILYNMENNDRVGYELSNATLFADVAPSPAIEYTDTPPVLSPPATQFWFDTNPATESSERLQRWKENASPDEWEPTHTNNFIWWVRTVTEPTTGKIHYNELYYKKVSLQSTSPLVYVETDWIMDTRSDPNGLVIPGLNIIEPARGNLKLDATGTFIVENFCDGFEINHIFEFPYEVPGVVESGILVPDKSLLKIFVNNVPAYYEFVNVTQTSFSPSTGFSVSVDVQIPAILPGASVIYEFYERLENGAEVGWQHNAHVHTWDQTPPGTNYNNHVDVHRTLASAEEYHGAYVLAGGNFLDKLGNMTEFSVHKLTENADTLRTERSKELKILYTDETRHRVAVEGNYEWLFEAGRTFLAKPYHHIVAQYVVERSFYSGGKTVIEIEPFDYDDILFYQNTIDIIEIDDTTSTIIIPCNHTENIFPFDIVKVSESTGGNNGVYTVAQVTYDFALNRTDVRITDDFPNREVGSGSPWTPQLQIPVNGGEHTKVIPAIVYEPAPTEVDYYDYESSTTHLTDATFLVPVNAVDPDVKRINYKFNSPLHVKTEYEIWDDFDIDAVNETFTLRQSGFKVGTDNQQIGPTYGLAHQFVANSIFYVKFSSGSYGCPGDEGAIASNDAYYVVRNVDMLETSPGLSTIIEVETDYNRLPPYGDFTINETSNNPGIGGRIVFDGNVTGILEKLIYKKFYVDLDVISVDPEENIANIISFYYDNINDDTIVDIEETIISIIAVPTDANIVDAAFIPGVFYDKDDPVQSELWNTGMIVWEGFNLDDNFSENTYFPSESEAEAHIVESLLFVWGFAEEEHTFDATLIDPNRNIIILAPESNVLAFQRDEQFRMNWTINNNKTFTVVEAGYWEEIPFIKVKETLAFGTKEILEKIDSKTVRVEGILRKKIKQGDEVFINKERNVVSKISYTKPYSIIKMENDISNLENAQEVWYREKVGKVINKIS